MQCRRRRRERCRPGAQAVDAGFESVNVVGPVLLDGRRHIEAHHEGAVAARFEDIEQKLGGGLLFELKARADRGAGVDDDADTQGQVDCWRNELTFSGAL